MSGDADGFVLVDGDREADGRFYYREPDSDAPPTPCRSTSETVVESRDTGDSPAVPPPSSTRETLDVTGPRDFVVPIAIAAGATLVALGLFSLRRAR